MSWLNSSTFKTNFSWQRSSVVEPPATTADPSACYDSFRQHWQQAHKIIERSQKPSHDDVLGVVNHLEQMVTLLLYELTNKDFTRNLPNSSTTPTNAPCLEYLLSENLLEKIYEWGQRTGGFCNAVRLEQMKLYEVLVSQSSHQLLVHKPFLRPLLQLLMSCQDECFPDNFENRLVMLLNQLCVSLMQNVKLLDLFFCSSSDSKTKFIIFTLLIPFVHREGTIGLQARDALLLCMSLSKKNVDVGVYIADHSNVCLVLATGLSGLYLYLPKELDIEFDDWHRLTTDDVKDIGPLALFMNSLEFCNAVAQIGHTVIKKQLLDFLYQGFLVPILGSAILESSVNEQVAATVYLDLILRSVTDPGLLPALIKFLLEENFNGHRILDVVVNRINGPFRLSLVSLALFETLIDLNCEDVMLELVFRHLRSCSHVMLSQRHLVLETDTYCFNTDKLLSLVPNCCRVNAVLTPASVRRNKRLSNGSTISDHSSISLPTSWTHYGAQVNETLYGNYHAYLCDARQKISSCRQGCDSWSSTYDYLNKQIHVRKETVNFEDISASELDPITSSLLDEERSLANDEESGDRTAMNSLQSLGESSGYESLKVKIDEFMGDKPFWKQSATNKLFSSNIQEEKKRDQFSNEMTSSVGLFLDIILDKLNNMLSNNFYVNLHLTGLISRLAIYPQTLLQSYLLNHQLVLQPNVRSIFQVVGSLKQKIDEYMARHTDPSGLLDRSRNWMVERESKIVNARRKAIETSLIASTPTNVEQPSRKEPHRSSITNSLSSVFRRTGIGNNFLRTGSKRFQNTSDTSHNLDSGNSSVQLETQFSDPSSMDNVALSAILLDEWLRELAAISQEHAIAQLRDHML